jgi:hypothetical protein
MRRAGQMVGAAQVLRLPEDEESPFGTINQRDQTRSPGIGL